MNNNLIIILGSTNDETGKISDIGEARLKKGVEIYNRLAKAKVLITGGYSKGIKVTEHPYSHYAKETLLKQGISEHDIVGLVMSRDTIEDAKLALPFLNESFYKKIIIVTSDFHLTRSEYIFNKVFSEYNFCFETSSYISTDEVIAKLTKTEIEELALLKKTGKSSVGVIL